MTRKTTVPIYDGDDFERLADLRREVDIATRKADEERRRAEQGTSSARLADDEPDAVRTAEEYVQRAKDEYDAFVEEASERAEMWVLHPIGHEEFRQLLRDHAPRKIVGDDGNEKTHPDDEGWDVNTETYPKALLLFVDPEDEDIRTVAEPFESIAALRKRIKRLSAGEFDTMWIRAHMLNNGAVADPKLSLFSPAGLRSDAT